MHGFRNLTTGTCTHISAFACTHRFHDKLHASVPLVFRLPHLATVLDQVDQMWNFSR